MVFFFTACGESVPRSEDVIVLDQRGPFPCRFDVVPSGIVLAGDLNGSVPDPGDGIVRTTDGRFLTTVKFGGQVAIWSARGEYLGSFGRSGSGPGEIAPGRAALFIDGSDSIHVRDNAMGWSVFDSHGAFARRMQAQHIGYLYRHTHFLENGTVLTTATRAGGTGSRTYFHVADRDGNLIKSFESVKEADVGSSIEIVSAYDGERSFWTAESLDADVGYFLQQWSLDGERLTAIIRHVPWYRTPRRSDSGERPPAPQVWLVHGDTAGLLLTYSVVANARWRNPTTPEEDVNRDMVDVYYEVIDIAGRTVLSSGRAENALDLPYRFFGRSRMGARSNTDSQGLESREIVSWRLSPHDEDSSGC